jgi:gamma-glutamyl phosphate reductase
MKPLIMWLHVLIKPPTFLGSLQAFQRLVYVSQLIYGDQKAAFLLPWRRHFNLTEAQLFVARRDNAKAIFKAQFESKGGDLIADRHFLRELRDRQLALKMMDESAVEVVKEYSRKHAEVRLTRALECIRATGKGK